MEQFKRPGIGKRLAQLGYLLKHTFGIVGRDGDILAPLFRMAIYSAVLVTLFYARLMHADALAPGIREELENCLKLDEGEAPGKSAEAAPSS